MNLSRSQFGHKQVGRLLNQLIRPYQERLGDGQAEGLGGLEVDHQLELRRLLDGKVAGLCALEDLVDVGGGVAIHLETAHSIGHEAPGVHEVPRRIDCGKVVLRCQVNDTSEIALGQEVETDVDGIRALLDRGVKSAPQVLGLSDIEKLR